MDNMGVLRSELGGSPADLFTNQAVVNPKVHGIIELNNLFVKKKVCRGSFGPAYCRREKSLSVLNVGPKSCAMEIGEIVQILLSQI